MKGKERRSRRRGNREEDGEERRKGRGEEEPKNGRNCLKLPEAGRGMEGYLLESRRKSGPANTLASAMWHPELWPSVSAMNHSLTLVFFVVAALGNYPIKNYFNCVTVNVGFLRIFELYSEAFWSQLDQSD